MNYLRQLAFVAGVFWALPLIAQVTKEDFGKYFRVPDLVIAEIEAEVCNRSLLGFAEKFDRKIPEGSLRDDDLKRLLFEIDRICDEASKDVRPAVERDYKRVIELFFSPAHYGTVIDPAYASLEKQQWADYAAQEIIESRRLSRYFGVIAVFDATRLVALRGGSNALDTHYGLGNAYQLERELLVAFSASSQLLDLLPNGKNLKMLGEQTIRNHKLAESRYYQPESRIQRSVQRTAGSLLASGGEAFYSSGARKTAYDKVQTLNQRLTLLMNPNTREVGNSGKTVCSFEDLDRTSVRKSLGDWRRINRNNGSPIARGSWAHYAVFMHFMSGCDGPSDFAIARRVLEDFVQTPEPPLGHGKECELAHWYRYGIGGRKDEHEAQKLEEMFTQWADRAGYKNNRCPLGQRIDPRNPWVDLY